MVEVAHAIIFGLVAIGFFILIAVLSWIDYKKAQNGENKVDPVQKGLILAFLIIGILFLAEAVGYFEKGWNQKNFWIHIILVGSIVAVYLFVAHRKNPLSYEKQKNIIRQYISTEYLSDSYIGDANINFLSVYKLTVDGEREDTRGEVGNFLIEVKAGDLLKIWVQINVYTGQLLHIQANPPTMLENRLLGSDTPKNDRLSEEFDNDDSNKQDDS